MMTVSHSAVIHPVVSAAWLQAQLLQAQLEVQTPIVIFDCRFSLAQPEEGRSLYTAGHLPGAIYLDLNQDLSSPPSPERGRHPLPDVDQLAAKLAQCGVNFQETIVVAYDDSRLAFAARLWWLLRYLGHDRVAVLDGGLRAWQALGYALTSDIPQPQPGQFNPEIRSHYWIDRPSLKDALQQPGLTLVDAREAPRYRGETEPIDPVAGRIPGAINACWQAVTEVDGFVKPVDFHRMYWNSLVPELPETEKTIVVYCGSGVTACVNLFSLALAGMADAKLYPGSWSEWCHCETAIERG
jgi:thiosulfate/3-mercaptopyruvate sulfurtransferase